MKVWELCMVITIILFAMMYIKLEINKIDVEPPPQAKCTLVNKMDAYYLIKIEGEKDVRRSTTKNNKTQTRLQ